MERDLDSMVRWVELQAKTWDAYSTIWGVVGSEWSTGKILTVLSLSKARTNLGAARVIFRQVRAECPFIKPGQGGIGDG